jgi:L-amino acid N-acyltransferase YncA
MTIRPATPSDCDAIWRIFRAVVASGTTYVFTPDTSRDEALSYFMGPGIATWVVEDGADVVGVYKLIPNRRGLGSHVANASYMVDPERAGRGAGKMMGLHSLREARRAGYKAMQFNFVVSTNTPAVTLWKRLGFEIVGTIPKAFQHRELGLVDAFVMHRFLDDVDA